MLIDGCQGAPHLKLDMQDIDCDFITSCHKCGPTGLGVLYAKKWLEVLPPYQGGGGMINEVNKEGITTVNYQINMKQVQWLQLK